MKYERGSGKDEGLADCADFTKNIVEFCSFLNIKAILLLRNLFLGVIYWQTIFLEKLNHHFFLPSRIFMHEFSCL